MVPFVVGIIYFCLHRIPASGPGYCLDFPLDNYPSSLDLVSDGMWKCQPSFGGWLHVNGADSSWQQHLEDTVISSWDLPGCSPDSCVLVPSKAWPVNLSIDSLYCLQTTHHMFCSFSPEVICFAWKSTLCNMREVSLVKAALIVTAFILKRIVAITTFYFLCTMFWTLFFFFFF